MPSWTSCYENVVIDRVTQRWRRSQQSWDQDLSVNAFETTPGPTSPGKALVYSYAYLNHHVAAAESAFALGPPPPAAPPACVLVDYGCGPGSALMALAESHFKRTGAVLKIHYLGCDTRNCFSIDICRALFDCIQNAGLITADSTWSFAPVDSPLPLPALPAGGNVYFSLCYVLAHQCFNPPLNAPGLPRKLDLVHELGKTLQGCRVHYGIPVHVVYVNPVGNFHAGWNRLHRYLGRVSAVQPTAFRYSVFDSDIITGKAGIAAWQAQRFTQPSRQNCPGTAACEVFTLV